MADRTFALRIAELHQVVENRDNNARYVVDLRGELLVPPGAFVAVVGKSGSGKSILLSVLGLLRRAHRGSDLRTFEMWFHDESKPVDLLPVWRRNISSRAEAIRRRYLGFAPQSGELLKSLTVGDNLAVPLHLNGQNPRAIRERMSTLLEAFFEQDEITGGASGNSATPGRPMHLLQRRLGSLSGGQYQRVAIARAIAHLPELLFVDEPTANLDPETAGKAIKLLKAYARSVIPPRTVFMITHDVDLAIEHCDHVLPVSRHTEPDGSSVGIIEPLLTIADYKKIKFPHFETNAGK